jgi:hypothetical protein
MQKQVAPALGGSETAEREGMTRSGKHASSERKGPQRRGKPEKAGKKGGEKTKDKNTRTHRTQRKEEIHKKYLHNEGF